MKHNDVFFNLAYKLDVGLAKKRFALKQSRMVANGAIAVGGRNIWLVTVGTMQWYTVVVLNADCESC